MILDDIVKKKTDEGGPKTDSSTCRDFKKIYSVLSEMISVAKTTELVRQFEREYILYHPESMPDDFSRVKFVTQSLVNYLADNYKSLSKQ